MTEKDCERIRDLLPEWRRGGLEPNGAEGIEEHLRSCPECRGELELIEAIRGASPGVPEDLAKRIQAKVREEFDAEVSRVADPAPGASHGVLVMRPPRRRVSLRTLSAAAMVILALGTGVVWTLRPPSEEMDPVDVASLEPLPESWLWDDGMVAGAPVFDGLSDEELEALLKEFEG